MVDIVESPEKLSKMIDHTNLKPDATLIDIEKLCNEAKKYMFASVCVNPVNVKFSAEFLEDSDVNVCTVVGFPLGANTPKIKHFEAKDTINNSASEIDMVMNIGALKLGLDDLVKRDIEAVIDAAEGNIVKVILETAVLTDDEKIKACLIAKECRADFVKTSTGFGYSGATCEDIALMRETVGEDMGIKASGGIKDLKTALYMINAGATRIGTSSGVKIMEELLNE